MVRFEPLRARSRTQPCHNLLTKSDPSDVVQPAPEHRRHVFICYSSVDREWVDLIYEMMAPILRCKGNGLQLWDDSKIRPGEKWEPEIETALAQAQVALLLVSAKFLASEFVMGKEVPTLLEAAKTEGVTILWVHLSACLVDRTPIYAYQAVLPPNRTLVAMDKPQQHEALRDIANEVHRAMVKAREPKWPHMAGGEVEPEQDPYWIQRHPRGDMPTPPVRQPWPESKLVRWLKFLRHVGHSLQPSLESRSTTSQSDSRQSTKKLLAGMTLVGLATIGFGSKIFFKPPAPTLRLAGSNTVGTELAPALVRAYFRSKGCNDVNQSKIGNGVINITCKHLGDAYHALISFKGSATAFSDLMDGSADVGMSSRKATHGESESFAGKLHEHVIALDGIAIIVHPSNQIPRLNSAQIRDLFSGKITSFGQVGGINKSVSLYRRDDNSGTFDFFKSSVMGNERITPAAKAYANGDKLASAVAEDVSGIGFVGHTHIGSARPVPIGEPGKYPLLPEQFTIKTEDYPLSRRIYLYSISRSSNDEANKFISFVKSRDGQSVVKSEKFVPLEIETQGAGHPTSSSSGYLSATAGAERLSVNFRFDPGSAELDIKARADLDRVKEFLEPKSNDPSKLILIGFTDSDGSAAKNKILSIDRAQSVADALEKLGITPFLITGFGEKNPIPDNATPEAKQRNRRVEAWVIR